MNRTSQNIYRVHFYVLYVSQNKQHDLIGFYNRDIARLLAVRTGSLNIILINVDL